VCVCVCVCVCAFVCLFVCLFACLLACLLMHDVGYQAYIITNTYSNHTHFNDISNLTSLIMIRITKARKNCICNRNTGDSCLPTCYTWLFVCVCLFACLLMHDVGYQIINNTYSNHTHFNKLTNLIMIRIIFSLITITTTTARKNNICNRNTGDSCWTTCYTWLFVCLLAYA